MEESLKLTSLLRDKNVKVVTVVAIKITAEVVTVVVTTEVVMTVVATVVAAVVVTVVATAEVAMIVVVTVVAAVVVVSLFDILILHSFY